MLLFIMNNIIVRMSMFLIAVIDSWGKPPSSVLEGNLNWLGSYDQCRSIVSPNNPNSTFDSFEGQYCLVNIAQRPSSLFVRNS